MHCRLTARPLGGSPVREQDGLRAAVGRRVLHVAPARVLVELAHEPLRRSPTRAGAAASRLAPAGAATAAAAGRSEACSDRSAVEPPTTHASCCCCWNVARTSAVGHRHAGRARAVAARRSGSGQRRHDQARHVAAPVDRRASRGRHSLSSCHLQPVDDRVHRRAVAVERDRSARSCRSPASRESGTGSRRSPALPIMLREEELALVGYAFAPICCVCVVGSQMGGSCCVRQARGCGAVARVRDGRVVRCSCSRAASSAGRCTHTRDRPAGRGCPWSVTQSRP